MPGRRPHPCAPHGAGRWEQVAGDPEVTFMHSVLLPNTDQVLYWGYTRADQSRLWDYSTPAGTYSAPANEPASLPGQNINTSDMWSDAALRLERACRLRVVLDQRWQSLVRR